MKLYNTSRAGRHGAAFIMVVFSFSILLLAIGCDRKMELKNVIVSMEDITKEQIEVLQEKIILFGHASVGNNIVQGMQDIVAADSRFRNLRIRELDSGDDLDGPGFYHFIVRKNGFPKEKCDHFRKMLTRNDLGNEIDIAFFKFCYVDIEGGSNVQGIFDYYIDTIEQVKKQFPNIRILHSTVPLYSHGMGLKGFIKRITKTDMSNIKRNEYNGLLIQRYKGEEPIYDLAGIESAYPDGGRSTFEHKGKTYLSLANEYTDDGGHLNKIGRYYAARNLLKVLSDIASQ